MTLPESAEVPLREQAEVSERSLKLLADLLLDHLDSQGGDSVGSRDNRSAQKTSQNKGRTGGTARVGVRVDKERRRQGSPAQRGSAKRGDSSHGRGTADRSQSKKKEENQ